MYIKTSENYSPNFTTSRRNEKKIKYIVYHYTGMRSESKAIKRLTDVNSKVSCHYFIKKDGNIILMVPELFEAWHAGKSNWKKDKLINQNSIGIEISNPGHDHGYINFNKKQIKSLIKISIILIKKYKIKKQNILGHSDVAPLRKKDPGERFPWKFMSENKVGIWHNIDQKKLKILRGDNSNLKINYFLNKLKKFGYFVNYTNKNELKKIIKSFQRRFRPESINGKLDLECLEIAKALI